MLLNEKRQDINNTLLNEFKGCLCAYEDYPIAYWRRYLTIALNTRDKRHFPKKRIDKLVQAYPDIFSKGEYVKGDDETPDCIRYDYTEQVLKEIEKLERENTQD